MSLVAIIVHASDLHIDGAVPDPRATRRAVVRLVDLAVAERADALVIAGDVFDRAADSAGAGRFFAAQMGRLRDAAVPVLAIAGNHDVACPRATGGTAGGVWWLPADAPATVRFDRLGLAVHGQGLADQGEPRDLGGGFPPPVPGYVNLGMLHTSLDGSASRTVCAPASVATLAGTGYDYWALGHVHRRWVVATDPWIVYPGAGGASVITTVAGLVATVHHVDLVGRGAISRPEISDIPGHTIAR